MRRTSLAVWVLPVLNLAQGRINRHRKKASISPRLPFFGAPSHSSRLARSFWNSALVASGGAAGSPLRSKRKSSSGAQCSMNLFCWTSRFWRSVQLRVPYARCIRANAIGPVDKFEKYDPCLAW